MMDGPLNLEDRAGGSDKGASYGQGDSPFYHDSWIHQLKNFSVGEHGSKI